jgi:hypothetical protein
MSYGMNVCLSYIIMRSKLVVVMNDWMTSSQRFVVGFIPSLPAQDQWSLWFSWHIGWDLLPSLNIEYSSACGVFFYKTCQTLGLTPPSFDLINDFFVGTQRFYTTFWRKKIRWKLSRKEIQEWISKEEDEFTWRETRNLQINLEHWKQRYIYTCLHEFFFVEFLYLLHEWIKRYT